MTEVWKKWESQVVNGVFPLRRYLGQSDHSVVFLTEYKTHAGDAAIKILPHDPALAETQLARWKTAATLGHPHLIRLFDSGRCQLGGHEFLFVVMEHAEQTLDEILPRRALTAEEVREVLPPTLDALEFLHGKDLVHGALKPANFLVVRDRLKLASDTIRPAGEPAVSVAQVSTYDPPEAKSGRISPAGDVWGLGVTLVQALTQLPPRVPDDGSEAPVLLRSLPAEFAGVVHRCLSVSPASRPAISELRTQLKVAPPTPAASVAQPVVFEAPADSGTKAALTSAKIGPAATAIAVGLVVVAVLWAGLHAFRGHTTTPPPAALLPPPQNTAPPAAARKETPPAPVVAAVTHQEIPNVPLSARETIQGHIKVAVRVTVDASGKVVGQTFANPGSSKYFARLAGEAAGKWKFPPSGSRDPRTWLLTFEFTRAGTTARSAPH